MTKQTNQLSLIDIENDFTEEEEAMFQTSPKRSVGMGTMPAMVTLEEQIVAKYQAGMPVTRLMRQYGISTTIMYKILNKYNVPLRGARNGSTVAKEFGETPAASQTNVSGGKTLPAPEHTITVRIPKSELHSLNSGTTINININFEGETN